MLQLTDKMWIASLKGRIQRNYDTVFKDLINQDDVCLLMFLHRPFIKIIRVKLLHTASVPPSSSKCIKP